MSKEIVLTHAGLAAFARKCRIDAQKSRTEAAKELGVARPTLIEAEEGTESNLFKLRKRIIEQYSDFNVVGPEFRLVKR